MCFFPLEGAATAARLIVGTGRRVSLHVLVASRSRNALPARRSFSSSRSVQSQSQQAHGSVPFSCRQLRRECASFTLSKSKYSSQYGRSSASGGSQKQVSAQVAAPASSTRACCTLCWYSSPRSSRGRVFAGRSRG